MYKRQQLDEPALTSDNLSRTRVELGELAARVYERLAAATERPQILLTTPYGDASQMCIRDREYRCPGVAPWRQPYRPTGHSHFQ